MIRSLVAAAMAMALSAPAWAETVLVTGANRGIGLEFARQYAAKGWTVIASARDPAAADDLQALAKANARIAVERLDVTDAASIAALAAKHRGSAIDVLINNAGAFGARAEQTFGSFDAATLTEVFAVNVFGPLKVSEAFVEHVAAGRDKKIILISSIAGSIASVTRPPGGGSYYAASKAAANMAMRGLSQTVKPRGIAVGIYHPGGVDTRMLREAFGMSQDVAEVAAERGDALPGNFKALTTEESVSQLMARFADLSLETSGTFISYDSRPLP
ncbi:MAG: SDR family NAD(P)-dependent oxidoreductase, partial [Alphaproteobacteria bacterium]|nr:SDR family NAD(P)-dependent oxidoreductase [Alphaproteobacteria bacterium]